jgi:hypothetical protein
MKAINIFLCIIIFIVGWFVPMNSIIILIPKKSMDINVGIVLFYMSIMFWVTLVIVIPAFSKWFNSHIK